MLYPLIQIYSTFNNFKKPLIKKPINFNSQDLQESEIISNIVESSKPQRKKSATKKVKNSELIKDNELQEEKFEDEKISNLIVNESNKNSVFKYKKPTVDLLDPIVKQEKGMIHLKMRMIKHQVKKQYLSLKE